MIIEEAIREGKFFALCILPSEFDPSRTPLCFEYKQGDFISNDGVRFNAAPFRTYEGGEPQSETSQHIHAEMTAAALRHIRNGALEKVVVSCIKHAPRNNQSLQNILELLTVRYPHAFVYAINHPAHGSWIGATPELLLRKKANQYRTISLAGTQPYSTQLSWSEKLQREQQLVTEFIQVAISNCEGKIEEIEGPYTEQAGPLAHLKTEIHFSALASSDQILNELHPTPAVCGMPRQAALRFLDEYMLFERRLYAGRLGILFPTGEEIHFVNLRCMQVFDDHFELHVGGGIVEGSAAEEEWHETELKADVLRSILH